VRRFADELDQMAGERGDSPASKVVSQVSQGGRRVADYLAEHGPEGLLEGVQDFARRRPGTFLLAAATAGFVVGRLGKGVFSADGPDAYSYSHDGDGTTTTRTDLLNADTQRLTPVPVQPVPAPPQTVGTSAGYGGTPAASTGGLAAEPIPTSTTVRP